MSIAKTLMMASMLATASLVFLLPAVSEDVAAHPCLADEQVADTGFGVAFCDEPSQQMSNCIWVYSDSDSSGNFTHDDFYRGSCQRI